MDDTKDIAYRDRLQGKETWWKQLLDVQRPYRANLRRLKLGHVLEVGCGIGRNLKNLRTIGIEAVGVDHNPYSVEEAKLRGFNALTVDQFNSKYAAEKEQFDSILVSHVLEHMTMSEAIDLLQCYLPSLKQPGQVVIITPQERGFSTDPTHVEFMDFEKLEEIMVEVPLTTHRKYSFPFPRFFGKLFTYNEFVVVAKR
ncbi:MAG: 2-polyprenyl-3-methyl-5-hydroxy-6-metoxy-1,4-benzoquinol methylase [Candidatus Azotimanducaceae bacterium]